MRRPAPALLAASLAALLLAPASAVIAPLGAQPTPTVDGKVPKRPKLPAEADTNDARDYWEWSLRRDVSWQQTYEAAYWAFRLAPDHEAYRLGQFQALFNRQPVGWRIGYYEGAEFVWKSKENKVIDSLMTLIRKKEPFVTLAPTECRITQDMLDYAKEEPEWAARQYYNAGCNRQAATMFAEILAKRPRLLGTRIDRATALFHLNEYGNALAELDIALDTLRRRDTKATTRFYQSKEMLEFMRAEILERTDDYNKAKQAYGKALEENLASYPAHARLARIALLQGELDEAVQEYDQAIQIYGEDGEVHHEYGVALLEKERFVEAEREFRRTLELEPYWALPYLNLAVALDKQGKAADAKPMYEAFLARAPRRAPRPIAMARGRLAAMATAGGGAK